MYYLCDVLLYLWKKKQSTKTTGKENNDIWTRNTESFGPVYGC